MTHTIQAGQTYIRRETTTENGFEQSYLASATITEVANHGKQIKFRLTTDLSEGSWAHTWDRAAFVQHWIDN